MLQSKLNSLLAMILPVLLSMVAYPQEAIREVRIGKIANDLYRVDYQLNQSNYEYHSLTLKIFRKRSGMVEELFSDDISSHTSALQKGGSFRYDWKAEKGVLREGDELQARIFMNYAKPVLAEAAKEKPPEKNFVPKAMAGPFREIQLPVDKPVVLDGSGSYDKDGRIVSVQWKQILGPNQLHIAGADSLKSRVYGEFKPGTYGFELTVTDQVGAMGKDRILLSIKPGASEGKGNLANNPVKALKDTAVAKSARPAPPAPVLRTPPPLKGGPSKALFNIALPGLGHYLVSGDPYGRHRKPFVFVISGLYLASVGGGVYYALQSDQQYNNYKELASYREYQRDGAGNIIGIRGTDQTAAAPYLERARSQKKKAQVLLGAGAGIFAADLVYTIVKGMRNKEKWKQNRAKAGVFLSGGDNQLAAGIQIKF